MSSRGWVNNHLTEAWAAEFDRKVEEAREAARLRDRYEPAARMRNAAADVAAAVAGHGSGYWTRRYEDGLAESAEARGPVIYT